MLLFSTNCVSSALTPEFPPRVLSFRAGISAESTENDLNCARTELIEELVDLVQEPDVGQLDVDGALLDDGEGPAVLHNSAVGDGEDLYLAVHLYRWQW
jgi:hypothetical protein